MPEPIEVRAWITPTEDAVITAAHVEAILRRGFYPYAVDAEIVTVLCVACGEPSVTTINGEPHCRAHAARAEERARISETECPSCDGGTGALCDECRTIAVRHGVL